MTGQLATQTAGCPNQRFVPSGYSKGALALRSTILSGSLRLKVVVVLAFGDPARNASSSWPINSPFVDLSLNNGNTSLQNITCFCDAGDLFCATP
ncbi:hypothetical protein FS749_015867 [Ceratobasidium sp. UAMH 11750]|nr:hypothetical protein FS749_015867 [Ceratobasidium sp. UAMH 11750]